MHQDFQLRVIQGQLPELVQLSLFVTVVAKEVTLGSFCVALCLLINALAYFTKLPFADPTSRFYVEYIYPMLSWVLVFGWMTRGILDLEL